MSGNSKYILLIVLFVIISFSCSYAQKKSRSQLEREKKENVRKIKEAEKILQQTATKKQNSIGQLSAIQQQIRQMQLLIASIKEELKYINQDIAETNDIIIALENDLKQLKEEYAQMVYNTYKTTRGHSKLTFIFSAATFNELVMRLSYMEQYGVARRKQTKQITKVKQVLSSQVKKFEAHKNDKNNVLQEQIKENKVLAGLKEKQNNIIQSLTSREEEIKKQIEANKKAVAKLNTLIDDIIKAEIAKSRKSSTANALKMTPEAAKLATSFASNKGKLPWPVETGFVSKGYGKQTHPVWKHVVMENKGVDIQTNNRQEVRSVFEGEVKKVAFVPGMGNVVMVQHGDYFTVYARLKDVYVQSGQQVEVKAPLGIVLTDNEGVSEVQFSVWKNNQSMDPKLWLYPK